MARYDYQRIDELYHSRIRLAIAAALFEAEEIDFTKLRDIVGATDGNMSTHLRRLEDAKYIRIKKEFVNRKPASYYSLTKRGKAAFEKYIDEIAQFLH